MKRIMDYRRPVIALFALISLTSRAVAQPEPGPENGGLRLRLMVSPRSDAGKEGYDVRLDLLNSSDRPITLRTGWRNQDTGVVKDYIEAAASIECVPEVAPWVGGVEQSLRTLPQSEQVLKAGGILSAQWQTEGRKLKNRVTDPGEVQNPEFPFPGLYSVHATVDVIKSDGTVRLRSNEQLVPVGGSRAMPKYTLGRLLWAGDGENKTATLGLGSLHKIESGDQFEIGYSKGLHWKLTITHVEPRISSGNVEFLTRTNYPGYTNPPLRFMEARFIGKK